ncbi:hypothetical protein ACI1US_00413 [Leucobacter sp. BZR 635]
MCGTPLGIHTARCAGTVHTASPARTRATPAVDQMSSSSRCVSTSHDLTLRLACRTLVSRKPRIRLEAVERWVGSTVTGPA